MKIIRSGAAAVAAAGLLAGCASSPKSIDAAYVSPVKFQNYSCDQIGVERTAIEYRANVLYHRLKRRANTDKAKMAVGAAVFFPALFFLKGNGTKAAEFAQLKGDYQALRITAEDRGCGVEFPDLEKRAAAKMAHGELVVEETQ